MKRVYECCEECKDILVSENIRAAFLWHDFSAHTTVEDPYFVFSFECCDFNRRAIEADIQMLESEGFLISHDTGNTLNVIKFLGHDDKREVICIHRHK